MKTQLAVLKSDIEFLDWDNKLVRLEKDTYVYIDLINLIAYKDNIHFEINRFEFDVFQ